MARPTEGLTREQVLAEHRPGTGAMYNGFSGSYMTCSCGWEGSPGDPDLAGVELVGHILDVLGLVASDA